MEDRHDRIIEDRGTPRDHALEALEYYAHSGPVTSEQRAVLRQDALDALAALTSDEERVQVLSVVLQLIPEYELEEEPEEAIEQEKKEEQ